MVPHKINDDFDAARMGLGQELTKIVHGAIVGVDGSVVGHVIAVVTGRRKNGHEPQASDAQITTGVWVAIVEVIQFFDDAL